MNEQSLKLNWAKFFLIFAIVTSLYWVINRPELTWLNYFLTALWAFPILTPLIGLTGAVKTSREGQSLSLPSNGSIENKVVFVIPTVCRNDVLPALERVIRSILEHAPSYLPNFTIHIVTEEDAEALRALRERYADVKRIRILAAPSSYQTPNGSKFKARANCYARDIRASEGDNTEDVYCYHLDDDTGIGADTAASIAHFIECYHGRYFLAQGVLTFPHNLTRSWLCRIADSIRPIDDLTRFKFFTGLLGRPLTGLHGEHLLIRADIEHDIGWDFGDTLVEDACFALRFAERYPGKSATLRSCSYGASPGGLRDLLKQRSRWITGLLDLCFNNTLELRTRTPLIYFLTTTVLGPLQHAFIVLLIAYVVGIYSTSPIAEVAIVPWSLVLSYFLWLYLEGLRINASVSTHTSTGRYATYATGAVLLFYVLTFIEALAVGRGILNFLLQKTDSFEVIAKQK